MMQSCQQQSMEQSGMGTHPIVVDYHQAIITKYQIMIVDQFLCPPSSTMLKALFAIATIFSSSNSLITVLSLQAESMCSRSFLGQQELKKDDENLLVRVRSTIVCSSFSSLIQWDFFTPCWSLRGASSTSDKMVFTIVVVGHNVVS